MKLIIRLSLKLSKRILIQQRVYRTTMFSALDRITGQWTVWKTSVHQSTNASRQAEEAVDSNRL